MTSHLQCHTKFILYVMVMSREINTYGHILHQIAVIAKSTSEETECKLQTPGTFPRAHGTVVSVV